ncbi:hypothetical protein [Planococcus sp. CAU13]|uniref:hypothetical protein n=1 Tax=Planococcus sp. CAU13 TaxID=1541197 RepID=UPI00052FF16A|nr:hypothetical protein [Planococcus sp. CAU13]
MISHKLNEYQIIHLGLGVLLTILGVYLNYEAIIRVEFPDAIAFLALGINQLLSAYLQPHIFPRDERGKELIMKSMTVSYIVIICAITVLFLATGNLGLLALDATQVLTVLFCIIVITFPGTMVIYSKII